MLALSTGSLYNYGADRIFALAKEAGFDAVEVLVDGRWDTRQVDYLTYLMEKHEIPVASLHSPFQTHRLQGWEQDPISRIKRTVELAEAVGGRVVVVHPPLAWMKVYVGHVFALRLPWPLGRAYDRWLREKLPAFQATTSVIVAVENMPCFRFGFLRLDPCRLSSFEALERFAYLTFDTTHWATKGVDLLQAYERLADRIVHVHLSNYNGLEHRLLTDGHLPLKEFLKALRARRYEGIVTLELAPESLQAGDEGKVREHLKKAVTFCRDFV